MPIYEKSTSELMRQFVAERPGQESFTADEIREWFQEHWPKIKRKN
jgi:ribonuclease I